MLYCCYHTGIHGRRGVRPKRPLRNYFGTLNNIAQTWTFLVSSLRWKKFLSYKNLAIHLPDQIFTIWQIVTKLRKKHINHRTAYKLLGNADIACALDEAHRREFLQHNHNATRFSKLLHHHIDVIMFLSAQGLAFRGHDESVPSSNRGNFLELIDLLGNYSHELRSFLDQGHVT